jgi:hypothetical protein
MLDTVLNNFGRILRHFAAPVVGLGTIYFVGDSDVILTRLFASTDHTKSEPSLWLLAIFTLAFGALLYHAHRTLFHWWFTHVVVCLFDCWRKNEVTVKNLDLARLHRENAPLARQVERASQSRLNDYNAACHFVWCSAWSVALLPAIISARFPEIMASKNCNSYLGVFLALFFIAFMSDIRATYLDMKAYDDYPDLRGDADRPSQFDCC